MVHRGGRAIFFADILWPPRAQFLIFFSGIILLSLLYIFENLLGEKRLFSVTFWVVFSFVLGHC